MKKKLIVVGSQGFLGSKICAKLSGTYQLERIPSDIWNLSSLITDNCTVLMLRAMSSPSYVQQNPQISKEFNVLKTSTLISESLQLGAKVIFTSSDVVYGHDEKLIFTESHSKCPYGIYAEQKSEVENQFIGNPLFFSLRLSLVVGDGSKIERILTDESEPKIPIGVVRNPVHYDYVVETINGLLAYQKWQDISSTQVLNLGGKESIDIFDLAQRISRQKKLNAPIPISRTDIDKSSRPTITRVDSTAAENFVNLRFSMKI